MANKLTLAAVLFSGAHLATLCAAAHAQLPAKPGVKASAPRQSAEPDAVATGVAAVGVGQVSQGRLTFYSHQLNGKRTASGEIFDVDAMTMAHRTLPMGTRVKVTNLANKRTVLVRVNDRGPSGHDRLGDLSPAAAQALLAVRAGVIDAELEVVGLGQKPR